MGDRLFRIGVLGLIHDHVWSNLKELQACQAGELIAAADKNEPLRKKIEEEFGCPTYSTYEAMLDAEQLDAVYIYGDNASGLELVDMAARRGLHLLIEKPLAASIEAADQILSIIEHHPIRLMVNWPFAWWPQMQLALRMAADGEIGAIWQVKYRAAHAGPKELGCSEYFCDWLYDPKRNGGGALIDYCCYGAILARCLLGRPSSVWGSAGRLVKNDIDVEDNGVIVMNYDHAIAISEGSWTQIGDLTNYMTTIYGSEGTLLLEPRVGGRLFKATNEQPAGVEVEVPPLPENRLNGSAHFLHCLASGEDFLPMCSAQAGRDAQQILSAAQQSSSSGKAIMLAEKD